MFYTSMYTAAAAMCEYCGEVRGCKRVWSRTRDGTADDVFRSTELQVECVSWKERIAEIRNLPIPVNIKETKNDRKL
jgi:hypothetical protein